jgi:hypothetical protein
MYHEYTNPLVIFIPKDTSIFLNLVYQFCSFFFKNHTLIFQNIIPINSKVRFFAISNIPSYEIFHQLCCFRKNLKNHPKYPQKFQTKSLIPTITQIYHKCIQKINMILNARYNFFPSPNLNQALSSMQQSKLKEI